MKTVRSGGGLSAADVFPSAGSWHSFRTVSYTHRDVYKRQVKDSLETAFFFGGTDREGENACCLRHHDCAAECRPGPVSYTHLEGIYVANRSFDRAVELAGMIGGQAIRYDAVSYTHLDVYKRQE